MPLITTSHFVLFLCAASSQSCEPAKEKIITPEGVQVIHHTYGSLADCQVKAQLESNVTPDGQGKFSVTADQWYECRQIKDRSEDPRNNDS